MTITKIILFLSTLLAINPIIPPCISMEKDEFKEPVLIIMKILVNSHPLEGISSLRHALNFGKSSKFFLAQFYRLKQEKLKEAQDIFESMCKTLKAQNNELEFRVWKLEGTPALFESHIGGYDHEKLDERLSLIFPLRKIGKPEQAQEVLYWEDMAIPYFILQILNKDKTLLKKIITYCEVKILHSPIPSGEFASYEHHIAPDYRSLGIQSILKEKTLAEYCPEWRNLTD